MSAMHSLSGSFNIFVASQTYILFFCIEKIRLVSHFTLLSSLDLLFVVSYTKTEALQGWMLEEHGQKHVVEAGSMFLYEHNE